MRKKKMKPIEVHKFKKKLGVLTKHHLLARSRGGESIMSNLFRLDSYKHLAWHLLFGNKTLDEIIKLLQRVKHLKESQRFYYKSTPP